MAKKVLTKKRGTKASKRAKTTKPNNPWGIKTGRLANVTWKTLPDLDFSLWTYGGIEN